MFNMFIETPTAQNILQNIKKNNASKNHDYIILCGENAALDIPFLIDLLNKNKIRFCGGFFPGVLFGNQCFSDKVLLLPVQFESDPVTITGLDSNDIEIPSLSPPNNPGSLFILVDGLSNWISKFIFSLYQEIGPEYQVFGSGTGFSTFDRKNCIFSKDGFFKDSAVIVFLSNSISQSTRHGWKTIAGPYLATKTKANLLEQINWEPAYKVYKEILEQEEEIVLTEDNYYEYAKHYPFGILRSGEENLIRDPISLEANQAIRFGAEIPSNSVLYLMKSEIKDMLLAGQEVCKGVLDKCKNPSYLFVADCISRSWILNEEFQEELNSISMNASDKNLAVFGVLSMGEISSANGALLDYHHKTIVISILEEND